MSIMTYFQTGNFNAHGAGVRAFKQIWPYSEHAFLGNLSHSGNLLLFVYGTHVTVKTCCRLVLQNQRWLSVGNVGDIAILVSKFELYGIL